jgi:hypothetical protein
MGFPYVASLAWKAVHTQYAATNTFRVGTLGMTEDGGMYRLCKAGAALSTMLRAYINANRHGYGGAGGLIGESVEAPLTSAIAVGDMSYTFTDATSSVAENYYQYGYHVQPRSDGDVIRFVTSSDAESSDTFTIHVASPFTATNDAGNTVHTYPSPWGNIKAGMSTASSYEAFVCVPELAITSGYYFWGKVHGPTWLTVTSTWPLAAANDLDVAFHIDGTLCMSDEGYTSMSKQRAGHVMVSGDYGDCLIMLQIE